MEWLIPWHSSTSPANGVDELLREVPRGHVLWGIGVRSLAYRQDCDDVLFALEDGSFRVAVVHLSFQAEKNLRWPETEIFSSLQEFASHRMAPDHDDFCS